MKFKHTFFYLALLNLSHAIESGLTF